MDEFKPPYLSFQTFWNFLGELAAKPLPPAIDRSLMGTKSGTDQANLSAALASFGLTDSEQRVTEKLRELVAGDEAARAAVLGELLQQYYPGPFKVSAVNGTSNDLNQAFASDYPSLGAGDTRRKAVRFFLHAAERAGLELSANFPTTRAGSGAPGVTRKRTSTKKRTTTVKSQEEQAVTAAPPTGGHTATVELASGGRITMTYDANMFALDLDDTEFLMGLIRQLKSYSRTPASAGNADRAEDDDSE